MSSGNNETVYSTGKQILKYFTNWQGAERCWLWPQIHTIPFVSFPETPIYRSSLFPAFLKEKWNRRHRQKNRVLRVFHGFTSKTAKPKEWNIYYRRSNVIIVDKQNTLFWSSDNSGGPFVKVAHSLVCYNRHDDNHQ